MAKRTPPHMVAARKMFRRALRLRTWKREGLTMDARWLTLRSYHRTCGHAGWWGTVNVAPDSRPEWVAQVIVHELAHICLYRTGHPDAAHDRRFQGLLLSASCEYFGLEEAPVITAWKDSRERWRGTGWKAAYQLDHAIVKVVRERDAALATPPTVTDPSPTTDQEESR